MKTWKGAFAVIIVFFFTGCQTEVTDKKIPVTGVELDQKTLGLHIGDAEQLTATVLPAKATDKTVTWKSSDTRKVTVTVNTATGVATVKGVAIGTADITVTAKNGKTATCVVTVSYADVTGVTLDQDDLLLGLGGEDQLTAAVAPKNADQTVTWSIAPEGFATVTNGKVTAVAVGEATITVTTTGKKADGRPETATCAVEVVPSVAVTGVTLDKSALELNVGGEPEELTATVSPRNASNKNVTWSSDDEDVATVTVNTITGVATVTAVDAGTAIITVTTQDGGKTATCEVTVTEGMPEVEGLVWIKPGVFVRGSPDSEPGRSEQFEPQRQVTLTQGFYMAKTEIQQGLFGAVMGGYWPSYFDWDGDEDFGGIWPYFPVDSITWFEAVEFCNKLSVLHGLTPVYTINNRQPATGYPFDGLDATRTQIVTTVTCNWDADGYRLPTESEWEYACRAGTTTAFNTGPAITLDEANFYDIDTDDAFGMTLPGGMLFEPNEWGLYDMHGNLSEWVWDTLSVYSTTPITDPRPESPAGNYYKVLRGGSWRDSWQNLRSAARDRNLPCYGLYIEGTYGYAKIGFRVVCTGVPTMPGGSSGKAVIGRNGTAMQELRIQSIPQDVRQRMRQGIPHRIR